MPPTTSNPSKTSGCFETIMTLDCIASTAFKLPKMISGIIKMVNKLNVAETINSRAGI